MNGHTISNRTGSWTIGREIGRGSFASVHTGIDDTTNKKVAIKSVLRSKLTKKLLENLESEILILKSIRHPNIVNLFDCLKTDTHIYLIMEFCEYGDLSAFIRKRHKSNLIGSCGGLPIPLVRNFLADIAAALQYLRKHNLVHRDIKPQNLLLHPPRFTFTIVGNSSGSMEYPILKIADFGFARVLPGTTLAETLCGSPLYMAPEILRYEKYDARSDLWSVGAVLYEMVTGRPPFHASNHIDLLRKIDNAVEGVLEFPPFPWDSGTSIAVPKDLRELIGHLLRRHPDDRIDFGSFFAHSAVQRPTLLNQEVLPQETSPILSPPNSPRHSALTGQWMPVEETWEHHPASASSLCPIPRHTDEEAMERDYVVVEKRTVDVNALTDESASSLCCTYVWT